MELDTELDFKNAFVNSEGSLRHSAVVGLFSSGRYRTDLHKTVILQPPSTPPFPPAHTPAAAPV
jgi:hypothetical protein